MEEEFYIEFKYQKEEDFIKLENFIKCIQEIKVVENVQIENLDEYPNVQSFLSNKDYFKKYEDSEDAWDLDGITYIIGLGAIFSLICQKQKIM